MIKKYGIMEREEVERLVLGIDENPTEAWKEAREKWDGGILKMPDDEIERRKEYKRMLADIFQKNGITENSFPDDTWLSGKIRRILK